MDEKRIEQILKTFYKAKMKFPVDSVTEYENNCLQRAQNARFQYEQEEKKLRDVPGLEYENRFGKVLPRVLDNDEMHLRRVVLVKLWEEGRVVFKNVFSLLFRKKQVNCSPFFIKTNNLNIRYNLETLCADVDKRKYLKNALGAIISPLNNGISDVTRKFGRVPISFLLQHDNLDI